jgi:DNA gyrase/topoisomerase IV subunit B
MAKTSTTQAYDSSSIQTLRFPDDIRSSPGMFIGSTDGYGLWVLIREMLDNAIDEFLAGRGSSVRLHVQDGEYWVLDDANGIPQGIQKHVQHINGKDVTIKTPTMQAVFGELHTSGKFHSEAYKISRGTHGIGVKATNALSKFLNIFTFYEGQWYSIAFKKGKIVQAVEKCKAPKLWDGSTATRGTLLHMAPDLTVFSAKSFPSSLTIEWAEIAALLSPGFKVVVSSPKGKKEFFSDKGPSEFVTRFIEKHNLMGERQMFEYKSELADVIIGFTNHDGCSVRGFVNGLSQAQGGKHVESVTGALYAGLKPFIKTKKVKEDGKVKEVPSFKEADLKEGLVGMVNMYLHKATYSSQDKARLSDDRAGEPFEQLLEVATKKFFQDNKALANRLCERAAQMNALKQKFTLSKAAAKALNGLRRNGLPAKFASWDLKTKAQDRELYIVEGDSAGGTVKKARFSYQGILPLKGKIFNALKDATGKTLESEEILNILAAIGYDVNAADPYAKLQVGKIVCLADPDSDGPFVGETKIRVRRADDGDLGAQPHEVEIQTLVGVTGAIQFEVPVWTGTKEIWASATAELVRHVDTLVALEIAGTKYKVSEDHKFLVHANTPAMRGRPQAASKFENLVFVRAADLHIGDRVFMPSNNGSRQPNEADKFTKLGFAPVSKLRIQKLSEPIPVYCLQVPNHHQFILPSGIVSSNCHINSLLLALFYRYLPDLFERGMVYIADAPEFYSLYKGQLVYGDSLSEVQNLLKKKCKAPDSTAIRHVKGYGELDEDLVKIMVMDPKTRKLIRIKAIETEDKVEFASLMNEDVAYRRSLLGLPEDAESEEKVSAKAKTAVNTKVKEAA